MTQRGVTYAKGVWPSSVRSGVIQMGCGVAQVMCGVAQLVCGVAQ